MEVDNDQTNSIEESMANEELAEDFEVNDNRIIKSVKKAAFVLTSKVEKRYKAFRIVILQYLRLGTNHILHH